MAILLADECGAKILAGGYCKTDARVQAGEESGEGRTNEKEGPRHKRARSHVED
jgi:hypothetical protein